MPKPSQRTHSYYKQKVALVSRCDICHLPIAGIPRISSPEIRKLNRTKRRISRLYGGQICHKCLKTAIKQAARTI